MNDLKILAVVTPPSIYQFSNIDIYEHRCLKNIKSYTSMMVNLMIISSVKLLLKNLWCLVLGESLKTAQFHLTCMYLENLVQ